ncbi:MAG TPA: GNAT family N-acetyltransferase [Clostridium sp.]|nr:GNAT family N-acetyltransferase [Clostridium sp.]
MTNREMLEVAAAQSAIDLNCDKDDFFDNTNKMVVSKYDEKARKYLKLPFECDLVYYGNNIVASVREDLIDLVKQYIDRFKAEHCFETPNLHVLNDSLEPYGLKICFMAEYFLPDLNLLKPYSCGYEIRILEQEEVDKLYIDKWSNALCKERKELDILVMGAYDDEKLIGLAGCSADCDTMWQIGIDVSPEYRRQGIATALTSNIALETLKRGKVPFYCAAWSNIKSVRNAIKSGFRPAWVEMTTKSIEFVNQLNKLY